MRLAVYGIGSCAKMFCDELENRNEKMEIVVFVQTKKSQDTFRGKMVVKARELNENDFDKLIIASDIYYNEIIEYLKGLNNGYELYKKVVKYNQLFREELVHARWIMPYQSCEVWGDIIYWNQ